MDRTGYFLLLLVPLVLALLCGGLEVFTFLTNRENRRRATEYSRQTEGDSNLAESDEAILSNLTVSVKALLEQSEVLRQKMEMVDISSGEEIAGIALHLEEILSVLNGITQATDREQSEEYTNKTVLIRDGCKTMHSTCSTTPPGPTFGNYTFTDCIIRNPLSNQDGEIIGNSATGYLIGKMVHRECSLGRGRETLEQFTSIPSVGSALDYISRENVYACRCYQMSNSTVTLLPIQCTFTVTICNERGTLAV